jgi:hypothetical protein
MKPFSFLKVKFRKVKHMRLPQGSTATLFDICQVQTNNRTRLLGVGNIKVLLVLLITSLIEARSVPLQ